MTQSVKPFASIDEQIDLLASRGLALDRAVVEQWLRSVGYYRLSGYWYPYREIGDSSEHGRGDHFVPGISLDDVARLYEFDRKLRTLIHDGIERIEVALRSHVSYLIGAVGPLAYRDASIFRPTFGHKLTVLRNTCAHHSRVWNRSFTPVSTAALRTIDSLRSLPEGQSERLYGALTLMGFLLQGISPGTTWTSKVRTLIDDSFAPLPGRTVAEMGFPDFWHEERLWSGSSLTL